MGEMSIKGSRYTTSYLVNECFSFHCRAKQLSQVQCSAQMSSITGRNAMQSCEHWHCREVTTKLRSDLESVSGWREWGSNCAINKQSLEYVGNNV
jgi:hypothetical protein